jgi:UDP-glucose 4-epimerase
MKQTIVVTGAAGYIGGQNSLQLADAGYTVVGIDRRLCPTHLTDVFDTFINADIANESVLSAIVQFQPSAIMHCAGTSLVGPSITNPSEYYNNNFIKTKVLLDLVCKSIPRTKFIFSSSAAVYGTPIMTPCHEVDPLEPISPYGESKLMIEQMMASYHKAYGLDYIAFRYFNACGADMRGRHGQEPGATHIIARVLESIRDNNTFTMKGPNYSTNDGSCVRDYVHVQDIADAHVSALYSDVPAGVYNLGTSNGTSNLEIISAAERITRKTLQVDTGPQRPGDPATLTASADKFGRIFKDWQKFTLDDMISHAWAWYNV